MRGARLRAGLATVASLLVAAGAAAGGTVIQRIAVERGVLVRFQLSAPVVARATVLPERADGRMRIAVDLDGATLGSRARQPLAGSGVILQVLPEPRGDGAVRVTIELAEPVAFLVESAGRVVVVRLQLPGAAVPPPTTPAVAQPDVVPGS